MTKPSEAFREMLRHIRAGDEATAKGAWKSCCEYVGGLEADNAAMRKVVQEAFADDWFDAADPPPVASHE